MFRFTTRLRPGTPSLDVPCSRRLRSPSLFLLPALLLLVSAGTPAIASVRAIAAPAAQVLVGQISAEQFDHPTLLVYNTVQQFLSGDLEHIVTVRRVQGDLAAFPPGWPAEGVGATNTPGRTGELIADGSAAALHFWWADPASPSQAQIFDLSDGDAGSDGQFPFLAVAVGNPDSAFTWEFDNVDDVHGWLKQQLGDAGIELAGIQLRGQFGPVKTTVSYNIPSTGLDLGGGYVGEDYFRFGNYGPATWTMDGVYAAAPSLQPIISTAGNPVHLHGYQPDSMIGGHITSAEAIHVTATIYPLDQVLIRRGSVPVAK
jgi:hypothetical protein